MSKYGNTLVDVRPCASANDQPRAPLTHTELFSDLCCAYSARIVSASHGQDRFVSELSVRMCVAASVAFGVCEGRATALVAAVKRIVQRASEKQVFRSDAGRVIAPVADLHPLGYGTEGSLVGVAVRPYPAPALPEAAVTAGGLSSDPRPALTGLVDERPKPFACVAQGLCSKALARTERSRSLRFSAENLSASLASRLVTLPFHYNIIPDKYDGGRFK